MELSSSPCLSKSITVQLAWLQEHRYTAPPSLTSGWLVLAFGAPIKTLQKDKEREREKCHCCVTATKSNKQETSSSVPILKIYFHFPFILLLTTLYYYQTFQQFVVFMLSGRSKKLKRSFAPSIKLQLRARTSHLLTAGGLF